MRSVFQQNGHWYKGNLHMHTTRSDGRLAPLDAIRLYRKAGYDFLAVTDHWKESRAIQDESFLLLSGCEYDTGDMREYPVYHLIGAGMKKSTGLSRELSRPPQKIIDAIREAGGIAILAHPAWSVNFPEECLKLKNLAGAEIYNTVSGLFSNARPDSSAYIDIWAAMGRMIPCFAGDDCHAYEGEETRSYIVVNAAALTEENILNAIRDGNFYASQGPEFESIELTNGRVEVTGSEVDTAVFYSNTVWCEDRVQRGPLCKAVYTLKPTDRYVRVELIDREGRHAWSSPFRVNE